MKNIFMLFVLLFCAGFSFAEGTYAKHGPITPPIYISLAWTENLRTKIPAFPVAGSAEQKSDEEILFKYQKNRTPSDCARAATEVHTSLQNLYGKPLGILTEEQAKTLTPFFEKVANEGAYFTQEVKQQYRRQRPFLYLKDLHPCIDLEKSPAYPSGHASISELFALVLGEIFPTQKEVFLQRARQIREDRVLAGVHHPSDITNGEKLGKLIFEELMKSPTFKKELEKVKTEIKG